MASKVDFNSLLAKAEKNANNAKKLLEEKKHIEKKNLEQKKANSISKEAALAFLEQQKKERQLKIEQEAQELLEKRRQKLEELNVKKPNSSLVQQPTSSKILKNNNQTNSSNGNAQKSSVVNKNSNLSTTTAKTTNNSTKSNNNSTKNSSLILKNGTSKNSNTQASKSTSTSGKPATASNNLPQKPKPKLTFEDMLKLAEQKEKELKTISAQKQIKSTSTSSLSESKSISNIITQSINQIKKLPKNEIQREVPISKHVDKTNDSKKDKINSNVSSDNNLIKKPKPVTQPSHSNNQSSNLISRLRPEQIEKLRQREQISTGNSNRPKSASSAITSNISYNRQDDNRTTKSMSAWDRAVADIKKKTINKNVNNNNNNNKNIESDEEYDSEEEVDSEMDDFIDDDDYEEDSKTYSKCIRKLFNYDPRKYKDIDDDDIDNMETDFHSQLKEEKRSLKLGILEDLEEERKEQERLERLKKRPSDTAKSSDNSKKLKK